jgi:hypothetical protein
MKSKKDRNKRNKKSKIKKEKKSKQSYLGHVIQKRYLLKQDPYTGKSYRN